MQNTFQRLLGIIHDQHTFEMSLVTNDTTLLDIGLDSLAVAELQLSIEDAFGIRFDDPTSQALPLTLGQLVDLIESKSPLI